MSKTNITNDLMISSSIAHTAVDEILAEMPAAAVASIRSRLETTPSFIDSLIGIVSGLAFTIMVAKSLADTVDFKAYLVGISGLDADIAVIANHVIDSEFTIRPTLVPRNVPDSVYLERLSLIKSVINI